MEDSILFKESQRFRQWWLMLILAGVNGLFLYGIYTQIIKGEPFGDKPASNGGLIMGEIVTLIVTLLILSLRLNTLIKDDGIYVKFFPFHLKYNHYSWNDLLKCYIRKYSFVEFGGWGIRYGLGDKGMAYNTSGNIGLQLMLTNNKKILIGTHKPEELKNILQAKGKYLE
ncbi:MAG: hypothetical protein J5I50_01745 [Chitinophagaceae bacterium]|nr:hypothetical protein [Chitinophagaceae bacterium]